LKLVGIRTSRFLSKISGEFIGLLYCSGIDDFFTYLVERLLITDEIQVIMSVLLMQHGQALALDQVLLMI
jgi:hypothetical protein